MQVWAMRGDVDRSQASLDFEAMWRAIPKSGLVPFLRDFVPEKVPAFLSEMVIIEVDPERPPYLRVRLAGTALNERARFEMTGTDYASYLPAEYRQGAIDSADLMVNFPCGLWQLMPVHYDTGVSRLLEITCFPLLGGAGRKPMLMTFGQDLGFLGGDMAQPPEGKLTVDTSMDYAYIDIGAGAGVPPKEAPGLTGEISGH